MMPKISIITPVYIDTNQKVDWLDEMIQSVLSQSVADWELILIDDKSPLSLGTARLSHGNDKRIRWLANAENVGPARTRNTAVTLAESECILPLDSDDCLANSETLEYMYDAWLMDKTKTIYGNVQLYRLNASGSFERGRIAQLANYSFEGAMNLQFGIMPVTTMHSKDAHYAAGGWKADLAYGREDLEYWIACGKAGFCGHKINHATLLYRKHEQSRDYKLKFENQQLEAMQQKIKSLHSGIYKGDFPMACCGKGKSAASTTSVDPARVAAQNMAVNKVTELEGYPEKDLEWVAYMGPKRGRFDIMVRGPAGLPSGYTILGTGHYFQIHKKHHDRFSGMQHLHYRVNQPDPRQNQEPEPIAQPEPQVVTVPKPELSTLVSLDSVGVQTRQAKIVSPAEVIIEPNPPQTVSSFIETQMPVDYLKKSFQLNDLGLSPKLTQSLERGSFTVNSIANTTPKKLSSLPGIGIKRANSIIAKAKELISSQ